MKTAHLPHLHDQEIVGLQFKRSTKLIVIELWLPESDNYSFLELVHVYRFYCSGGNIQNVVLDAMVYSSHCDDDYLLHCYKLLNIDYSIFEEDGKKNGMEIIYIEPSVGMEIACCCQSLVYYKGNR